MSDEYQRGSKRDYYDQDDYDRGRRQGYSDYKNYDDDDRYYRDEGRGQYGQRGYDDGRKGYGRGYYEEPRRGDYGRKQSSYYNRGSDQDYGSRKGYGYDEYYKKPKIEGRAGAGTDAFYREKQKTKHVPAEPNCTVGVFGFNPNTTEEDLKRVLQSKLKGLSDYTFKLIMDERTNLCKGYCFIHFACLDDAITVKHTLNLEGFRGQDFKCDYSYKHGIVGE